MEAQEKPVVEAESNGDGSVLDRLKATRQALAPFGKKKNFEVPGYNGLLTLECQYISSEVTEKISRDVMRETKDVNNQGMTLLSALDTLEKSCVRVLMRGSLDEEWQPIDKSAVPPIKLEPRLAAKLGFTAGTARETTLGIFGSEHAVIGVYTNLSRWLSNVTREGDLDFLA